MSHKPSRPSFPVLLATLCVACTLLATSPAGAAQAPRARSLTLPEGTVTKWTIAVQPSLQAIPFSCELAMPGPWLPRFAMVMQPIPLADASMLQAQQYLPLPAAPSYTPTQAERWIADALKRTRRRLAQEEERLLAAKKKEEEAEKARANAAYVPPTSPPTAGSPPAMPLSTGTLLQAPVTQAPATTATGARQPAASVTAGTLLQAPVTKTPDAKPAETKAPATAAAPAPASPQAAIAKNLAAQIPTPPAAPAKPSGPAGTMHAGSLLGATVNKTPEAKASKAAAAPQAPAQQPAKAPGKEVAALTPPPSPTAPATPPKSIVPKAATSRNTTQDPTVLATPEGKHAHDSFRQFCSQFVQKVGSSYDKGTITNIKVEKRDGKYVARYVNLDQNSVHLLVKTSGYDHTPFVGVLQYSEQLFEAEGDTAQAAKAGAFKMINSVTVRELFRYANKKWQF